ncbi:MAG: MBL fold metallo-hydrolase [Candidatus Marinamargulisbacteria bacterium]
MLTITTIPVTSYQQNARILIDTETQSVVIVDPGGDVPKLMAALPPNATVSAIWITHSHIDHVSGVAALLTALSDRGGPLPDVLAHPDDIPNREALPAQSAMTGFPYSGNFEVTKPIVDNDVVSVGNVDFKVLHTPGHAVGHVSFYSDAMTNKYKTPLLIAGDALFKGSIGRTDLPGGNSDQLLTSIQKKLFVLPGHTTVLSGHGFNTTIAHEMATNPFFTA